jgi:hypothetical protein
MIYQMALTLRALNVVGDDGRAIQVLMIAGYSRPEIMANLDAAQALARLPQAARRVAA